jgi:hypothetical protein
LPNKRLPGVSESLVLQPDQLLKEILELKEEIERKVKQYWEIVG